MTVTQTGRRLALVGLLALVAALFPLAGATAQTGDVTLDLEGETNVEYALAWSQVAYQQEDLDAGEGPTRALIGRDDLFPDNLASGVLQDNAPLLLSATSALSADTEIELDRLGVTEVTILGGNDAVDPAVEAELSENYTVDRLEGPTRIETAIAIAAEDEAETTAILARAYPTTDDGTQAFADSLAAGAWAAADGYDVLLTQTEVLTGNTADYLATAGYEKIYVVGGEAAISQATFDEAAALTDDIERVSGATRFETAIAIANERGFTDSADTDVTLLVDGQASNSWADGFPAANIAGVRDHDFPVVLANSADTELPQPTVDFLVDDGVDFADNVDTIDLICGSSVPDEGGNDQCQQAADETGTTVVEVVLTTESGTITAVDTANDTVTFVPTGETDPVTETYDPATDTFIIDGELATAEEFEQQADPGDEITVVDNEDGTKTFILENVPDSGVVGNVDLLQFEYDIIDPATGAILRENISFAGDLFTVDGATVTETVFVDDINEGDTVTIEEDTIAGTDTHNLDNQAVTGTVSNSTAGADTTTFQVDGVLGDDPLDGDDVFYEASLIPSPGLETYTVDGVTGVDYATFAAAVSDGDTITYTRSGDIENFDLTNA